MAGTEAAELVLEPDAFQKLYPVEYYDRHLAEGLRPDKRVLSECRVPVLARGTVGTADASASVKLGETFVLAGVKLESGVPSESTSDAGDLIVQVEVTGLSSADAAPGRSSDVSAPITQLVSTVLHSPRVVDLKKLCILEAQACWQVHVDIYVMNDDGGLVDACLMAAVAALASLQVPAAAVDTQTGKLQFRQEGGQPVTTPFPLLCQPVSLTLGIYRSQLVCDLTRQEEHMLGCVLSLVIDEAGRLHGVQKMGGEDSVSKTVLQSAIAVAAKRRAQFSALLQ